MSKITKRKFVYFVLCLAICLTFSLTGCVKKKTSKALSSQSLQTKESSDLAANGSFTDMVGRSVTVPAKVDTVYCAVPTAEPMVYSLAPQKLCAWVFKHTPVQEKYMIDSVKNLPILGGWMGAKCTANMEEIAEKEPQLIVFMTKTKAKAYAVQTADLIQQQTKIPVVVMDLGLKSTPEVYRELGKLIGVPERAEKLASWSEKKMKEIRTMVAKIPENKLVSVYYAEGKGGLYTDPAGSVHEEALDFVRGKNVADVQMKGGQGMTSVSMEQVLLWNPQVILTSAGDVQKNILSQESWKKIRAVSDHKVYTVPAVPFNWFDRPPNIMRVIGIEWLAQLLYPDYVSVDLKKDIKDFYSLFLGVTLTDSDVTEILKGAQ